MPDRLLLAKKVKTLQHVYKLKMAMSIWNGAMVLCCKTMDCPLPVMECEVDRQFDVVSACDFSILVERELIEWAKLLIYQSI